MKTISGFWAGTYAYPNEPTPAVNFDCELRLSGSAVTGQITESHALGQMLVAKITGQVVGSSINFIKRYQTSHSDYLWEIDYTGIVGPKKDEITGIWRVGGRQGTFSMQRDAGELRETEVLEAEDELKN